jgi:hypothetical protein
MNGVIVSDATQNAGADFRATHGTKVPSSEPQTFRFANQKKIFGAGFRKPKSSGHLGPIRTQTQRQGSRPE